MISMRLCCREDREPEMTDEGREKGEEKERKKYIPVMATIMMTRRTTVEYQPRDQILVVRDYCRGNQQQQQQHLEG